MVSPQVMAKSYKAMTREELEAALRRAEAQEAVAAERADRVRAAIAEHERAEKAKTPVMYRYAVETRRCGKETCKCALAVEHQHGPYVFLWTYYADRTRKRRYVGTELPPGAELNRYVNASTAHASFRRLPVGPKRTDRKAKPRG